MQKKQLKSEDPIEFKEIGLGGTATLFEEYRQVLRKFNAHFISPSGQKNAEGINFRPSLRGYEPKDIF